MPRVVCGAEVKYYPGIARMAGLERLCIENTRLLLLEMPAAKWTEYTLSELNELALTRRLKVVLAHVERYLSLQDSATLDKLFDSDIYMQTNASCFLRFATRAKALRRLEAAEIQFVGSDCHNMTSRAPNADKAYALIEKKLGGRFAARLDSFGRDMLEEI
jgi:protein-tyrosine phosphatase